ncbi:MAG TPA: pirin family protein, partial [Thermoanaerobaculia bacterium]
IGLQTVSWLLEGEVLHRDSLGFEAMATPGTLNLMTSGRGIAHSEETPAAASGRISGVQLWIALPDADRNREPDFEHHRDLPVVESGGTATVLIGSLGDARSNASAYSDLVGAELRVRDRELTLPLDRAFEHALFVLDGNATLEGEPLAPDILYYLGTGRGDLALRGNARLLLLGGPPFAEPSGMWWNFVARSHEEIAAAREEWDAAGGRFGEVRGYAGPRIPAPPLHHRAKPNAMS